MLRPSRPSSAAPPPVCAAYNGRAINHCEDTMSMQPDPDLNPGDEAEPGTPGAGEDVCEACAGTGKLSDGRPCSNCGGSGKVMRGIGGG